MIEIGPNLHSLLSGVWAVVSFFGGVAVGVWAKRRRL